MKKWWIGLLLAAVALVMIPATALAVKHEGEKITHFCSTCGADRECVLLQDITSYRHITETQHQIVYRCLTCQIPTRWIWEDHYGGSPTCSQAAECAGCGESYTLAHTWVAANCTAPKNCSGCGLTEGIADSNNHVGPMDAYDCVLIDQSNHTVRQQCRACKAIVSVGTEAHTASSLANCVHPAKCEKCKTFFGGKDPDNHDWGAWAYKDANTHSRQCKRPECAKVESTPHSGGTATCIAKAECDDCHSAYGDLDAANHENTRTSYANATGEQHRVTVVCEDCNQTVSSTLAAHTWGDWTADGTTHTRTCQSPGCGAVDTGRHTSEPGATCVTAQTCAICDAEYLDPGNHEGERKTTYAIDPEDETRHIVMQICAGCRATLTTASGGHTTDKSATCMKGMHCKICDLYYGATVDHVMSRWLPADDGQRHYRTCEYGCGKTEYGKHNVSSPATCAFPAYCKDCGHFGDVDADAHDWSAWKLYDIDQHYRYCRKNKTAHVEYADHTGGAATCETRAMCDVCNEYYGQMLGHDYVMHDAQAATCTEIGWAAYATCSRCDYSGYAEKPALGHDYAAKTTKPTCTKKGYTTHTCTRCQDSYRDEIVSALGHWYGEWTPNADGTNSASCLRDAYEHTVDCVRFSFVLTAEDVRTEFVLCPVCGEVSEIRLIDENGEVVETREAVRLLLVEDAKAEALTECLPEGELVVRMGALESGDVLMSVAFEIGGEPTQPTGQVKITLPAGLLEGYALCLLSEDGTEAELTLEGDEEEETVSFTLDFTNSETPVQVIRLIPEV